MIRLASVADALQQLRFLRQGLAVVLVFTGAKMIGSRIVRPNWLTDASTLLTSRSTRGRNAMVSSAMRLRRSVVSDSTPPTM